MPVKVLSGELTRLPENMDAIIVLLNLKRNKVEGVHEEIIKIAGQQYHNQAIEFLTQNTKASDYQTIIAKGREEHGGSFRNVIFVIDNLDTSLDQILLSALEQAEKEGYRTVALNLLRLGEKLGSYEQTVTGSILGIHEGVNKFRRKFKTSNMNIYIVVSRNPSAMKILKAGF